MVWSTIEWAINSISVFWGNCIPRLGMESVLYSGHRKCFIGVRLVEGARGRRNDRSGNCSTETSQISHLDSCCKIICLLQSKHREKGRMIYSITSSKESHYSYCVHALIYILTLWLSEWLRIWFFSPKDFTFIKSFFFCGISRCNLSMQADMVMKN